MIIFLLIWIISFFIAILGWVFSEDDEVELNSEFFNL